MQIKANNYLITFKFVVEGRFIEKARNQKNIYLLYLPGGHVDEGGGVEDPGAHQQAQVPQPQLVQVHQQQSDTATKLASISPIAIT